MPVDLGDYEIVTLGNVDDNVTWETDGESTPLPHVIVESGDVFVICNSQSNDDIKAVCDLQISGSNDSLIYGLPVFFNGNDARSLAKGGTRIDDIGAENMVLTDGKWSAGGVDDATAEHTLVRVSTVMGPTTDWLGTAATDWTVLDQDVITDLGMHTYSGSCTAVTAAADIVINEVVADPLDGEEDWIELYNNTDAAVDLGDWTLDDNSSVGDSATYTFSAGTMIPANGFLVLNRNTDFTFDLGSADWLVLRDGDGVYADAVTWIDGYAPEGWSYGRLPDGTGAFQTLTLPTADAANQTCGDAMCVSGESCGSCPEDCGTCADVALNEVLWDSADSNPAFVELLNLGDTEADISGWMLMVGDSSYVFPASTTIASGAYLVIDESTHGLTLLATDSLALADDAGFVLETAAWDGLAAGDSWGRFPNGTGLFTTLTASSPGAENVVASTGHCASDLFFSEYIEGGGFNKAIEIANFTGAAVDLSGYEILTASGGAAFNGSYALTGTLADGDVYVLCHQDITDTTNCDEANSSTVVNFNGDDPRALAKIPSGGGDSVIIDVIGLNDGDPGGGWEVATVTEATKDHTIRRLGTINGPNADWAASQASEWEVLAKDTLDGLGAHTYIATCD